MNIHIRPINEHDHSFIIALAQRLDEVHYMEWRHKEEMRKAQERMAREAIATLDTDSSILIAENEDYQPLGYIHLTKNIDFFTGEEQGYISSIAVAEEGEGKGIGTLLMKRAEEWCKEKNYKQLVLHVFANNERAVRFYENLEYEVEVAKMVKVIK